MIKQECIGIPDMILLLMNFFVSKKIKIKAEIVLSPGGAYFYQLGIRFFYHRTVLPWPYNKSKNNKEFVISGSYKM